jgi:hypothetical protein
MPSAHEQFQEGRYLCDRLLFALNASLEHVSRNKATESCSCGTSGSPKVLFVYHRKDKITVYLKCDDGDEPELKAQLPPSSMIVLTRRKTVRPGKAFSALTPYFIDLHHDQEASEVVPLLVHIAKRAEFRRGVASRVRTAAEPSAPVEEEEEGEHDGKLARRGYGGPPESMEHLRLKCYVKAHPQMFGAPEDCITVDEKL